MIKEFSALHCASGSKKPRDGRFSERANCSLRLSVAVVSYRANREQLEATLASLERSLQPLRACDARLFLVDNNPDDTDRVWLEGLARRHRGVLVGGHGNVGFGRAHNFVLSEAGEFHLVLNPDVELSPDCLSRAIAFMEEFPDCGLLSPSAHWEDGERQYLCKQMPSVLDLLLRGFAPAFVRRWFATRLAKYEMRQDYDGAVIWDPPIVSGCFMLFRGDVFRKVGGFDPRYFLYFEDFDLSLRVARIARIAYVPSVQIVHHGGHAARKGLAHVRMFARSALIFFRIHGWRWW